MEKVGSLSVASHTLSTGRPNLFPNGEEPEAGRHVVEKALRQAASGSLSIVSREGVLTVSLRRGWVVGLSPSQGSADVGLGDLLVEQGYLGRIDLDALLEASRSGGRTLRELILERGLVPSEALGATLQEWVEDTLVTAFGWQDATFQLHPGAAAAPAAGWAPFPLLDFLLSSHKRLGERSPLPASLPESTGQFRVLGNWDAERGGQSEDLSEIEVQLLDMLDQGESLHEIAPRLGMSVEAVRVFAGWLEREGRITRVAPDAPWKPALAVAAEETAGLQESPVREAVAPPEPVVRPARRGARDVSGALSGTVLCTGLAILAFLGFGLGLWLEPMGALLPLPWSAGAKRDWADAQRATASQSVEVAAVTYALLEGRWPEGAEPLVREGLVNAQDVQHLESGLEAPAGQALAAKGAGESAPSGFQQLQFSPNDNFFLQQHASQPEDASAQPPLKLLD
jgi:hypothetical protein